MTSPPDSGRLFFSSSPTRYSSGPAEEVDAVLAQVQKLKQLDPSIGATISVNRSAFFETFSRRVELIKSRSQAFQDCHVTVFDKVLLILTQNGKDLDNTAAISYFCEEHLGIPSSVASIQKKAVLSDALVAPPALTQATSPPETRRESVYTRDADSNSPEKKHRLFESDPGDNPAVLAVLAAQIGEPMMRLWTVYDKAKKDFFAVPDSNSLRKQQTAKFLRDTAENVLHHLRDKRVDQRLLDELNMVFELAKQTATTLHGGKKRKFDHPTSASLPTRGPRPNTINDFTRPDARPDKRSRNVTVAANHLDLSEHSPALAGHGRNGFITEMVQDQKRFSAPGVPSKDSRPPRQNKKQPGRGHSGVPFGYTRPVDSYYPA